MKFFSVPAQQAATKRHQPVRGFAAVLAESLWLSVNALHFS